MRWPLVLLAACSSSPSRQTSPEPLRTAAPPADAVAVEPPPPPPDNPEAVARGATLFEQRACKTCHDPGAGVRQVGAPLHGLWGTQVALADGTTAVFDEAYIRESILDPQAKLRAGFTNVMPAFPIFTDAEMADIVAYIKSLR